MNRPHLHKGHVWDVFPCEILCDVEHQNVQMVDCWRNRWLFKPISTLIANFMFHVCGVSRPLYRVTFKHNH